MRIDLADRAGMEALFKTYKPQRVVILAAQAGVRYSLENPLSYIDSNLVGFGHILEGCRHNGVEHLVYASSSSVYGANTSMPFSVHGNVDHPLSLYAATKKANELMAIPTAISMACPQRVCVSLLFTDHGIDPTWPCRSSHRPSPRVKPFRCLTTATIAAISPTSMTLSKVLSVCWIVRHHRTRTGPVITPIRAPAWHLGGSTTSGTTGR